MKHKTRDMTILVSIALIAAAGLGISKGMSLLDAILFAIVLSLMIFVIYIPLVLFQKWVDRKQRK